MKNKNLLVLFGLLFLASCSTPASPPESQDTQSGISETTSLNQTGETSVQTSESLKPEITSAPSQKQQRERKRYGNDSQTRAS